MNSRSPAPVTKRVGGFTLLELLVVVAIIGILAALISPMLGVMQNRSRNVQAINDMRNLKTAIVSYYADYRKYPINVPQATDAATSGSSSGKDAVYGDPGGKYTNANLLNILRAIEDDDQNANNTLNPNKTVYWEGQMVKDRKNPHSGITYDDFASGGSTIKKGTFVDPWGNPYIVWIDSTNDGDLSQAVNQFYTDVSATDGTIHPGLPPMGLEFGSLGPDGKPGTKGNHIFKASDDVVTW